MDDWTVPIDRTVELLAVLAMLVALAGAVSGATSAAETDRVVVAVDEVPEGLEAGDRYLDATVAAVYPETDRVALLVDDAEASAVEEREEVRWTQGDGLDSADGAVANDPRSEGQYALDAINVREAWAHTKGETSVRLCIVDSGIALGHEDIPQGRYVAGKDFVDGGAMEDPRGHGTHVTGIAAAGLDNRVGIAGVADVGILHARVLDEDGSGWWSDISAGIDWCVENGADVVNLSLGSPGEPADFYHESIQDARAAGVLVVASAGNDDADADDHYPAAFPETVSVACTDGAHEACSFSNAGSTVDLAAPGYSVVSTTGGGYAEWSGTSMSAPHVTGVAGLVLSADPSLDDDQLEERLTATAWLPPGEQPGPERGAGVVDAGTAVAGTPSKARGFDADPGPSSGTIQLAWEHPRTSGASDRSAYVVYRGSIGEAGLDRVATLPAYATSFVDEDPALVPGVGYEYRLVAANGHGEGPAVRSCATPAPTDASDSCWARAQVEQRSGWVAATQDTEGLVAVSGTGTAHGSVAVSATGDASAGLLAVSGTGEASARVTAVSAAGDATGCIPASGLATARSSCWEMYEVSGCDAARAAVDTDLLCVDV